MLGVAVHGRRAAVVTCVGLATSRLGRLAAAGSLAVVIAIDLALA